MKVSILVKKDLVEVCKHLERKIKSAGKSVAVFCKPHEFYSVLKEARQGDLDYAMIDVRTFQSDSFNPYAEVALMTNPVPLIVFNDPYPEPDNRASFWLSQNKKYLSTKISDEAIDRLSSSFLLLQDFFNGEINKYIPAIAKPVRFLSEDEKQLRLNLDSFRVKNKLPPSRLKLFEYFLRNMDKELSEEAIVLSMFGECTQRTKGRFYTYICNLRKVCKSEEALKIEILRTFKEHYMMKVSLPTDSTES